MNTPIAWMQSSFAALQRALASKASDIVARNDELTAETVLQDRLQHLARTAIRADDHPSR